MQHFASIIVMKSVVHSESHRLKKLQNEIELLKKELDNLSMTGNLRLKNDLPIQSRNLDLISSTAAKMLGSISFKELFRYSLEQISLLINDSILAFTEFDTAKKIAIIREVECTGPDLKKIVRIFGNEPAGYTFKFTHDIPTKLSKGGMQVMRGGFHELVFGKLPKSLCRQFERELEIEKIFAMPCIAENEILGVFAIITRQHSENLENKNIIEIIVNQAALTLKRKRSEEKLIESEQRYRQLIESAGSIIMRWNMNGTIVFINDFGLKFFGYTREELVGSNVRILLPEFDNSGNDMYQLIDKITSNPVKYIHSENENILKDGKRVWVRWANRPVLDKNGTLIEILSIGNDITPNKKIEEKLKTEHDILEAVVNNTGLGFLVTEPGGGVVLYNESLLRIHGLDQKTANHINIKDYFRYFIFQYPDGRIIPIEEMPFPMALNGKFVRNLEMKFVRCKDMSSSIISINSIPVFGSDGFVKFIVFTMNDLTEIYERNEALNETRQRYESLFNNATMAIFHCKIITDENGNPIDYEMIHVNNTFTELTGVSMQDVQGKRITEIFPGIENNPFDFIGKLGRIALTGGELNEEFYFDELGKWFSIYAYSPKKGEFTALLNEISERKNYEIELKKAKDKAEENDRLKSVFLANMSHEIRTPMNGILGFADLLKQPDVSGESQKQYIEIIESSGKRMLSIINDLIDISRIEAGQIEIRKSSTEIYKVLDELIVFFMPEAVRSGISLSLNYELPGKDFAIQTDRVKLSQIITNLVKNALKFTGKGGMIEVGCRFNDDKSILFYVRDTGIGVRKELQDKIFERFRQGDIPAEQEGVGLGLAISKAYVELMGGQAGLESEPGKGSIFYFTIPYEGTSASPVRSGPKENPGRMDSISSKKVLVVEDDEMSYRLINEILHKSNVGIIRAENGLEAVEIIKKDPGIDLVIMDLKLPVMDGIEATTEIKKIHPEIPVIIQSAYAGQEEIDRSFKAGSDDYMTKPINSENLLKKVIELIS